MSGFDENILKLILVTFVTPLERSNCYSYKIPTMGTDFFSPKLHRCVFLIQNPFENFCFKVLTRVGRKS